MEKQKLTREEIIKRNERYRRDALKEGKMNGFMYYYLEPYGLYGRQYGGYMTDYGTVNEVFAHWQYEHDIVTKQYILNDIYRCYVEECIELDIKRLITKSMFKDYLDNYKEDVIRNIKKHLFYIFNYKGGNDINYCKSLNFISEFFYSTFKGIHGLTVEKVDEMCRINNIERHLSDETYGCYW